jgi:hypothetical protein
MTERGARGVLRRLEAGGWLSTSVGGGRGGSSRYTVLMQNPEHKTGNFVPGIDQNPERDDTETRNVTTLNPEPRSAEPSRTIIREPKQQQQQDDYADRETILEAMGHPASGLTATGRIVGNPADMLEAQRWRTELGLSMGQIVGVISELAARPTYRPPRSFGYFREAMRDRAGLLSQAPLTPIAQPTQAVKIDWTRYGLPPD